MPIIPPKIKSLQIWFVKYKVMNIEVESLNKLNENFDKNHLKNRIFLISKKTLDSCTKYLIYICTYHTV